MGERILSHERLSEVSTASRLCGAHRVRRSKMEGIAAAQSRTGRRAAVFGSERRREAIPRGCRFDTPSRSKPFLGPAAAHCLRGKASTRLRSLALCENCRGTGCNESRMQYIRRFRAGAPHKTKCLCSEVCNYAEVDPAPRRRELDRNKNGEGHRQKGERLLLFRPAGRARRHPQGR